MDKIIYAEILGRNGRVKQRIKLDHFPAMIGAAYSNDVILDDRYVAACEIRIELNEQGEPVIIDGGTVNGIVKRGSKKPLLEAPLCSGDQFRIGHSDIRFIFSDHPVDDPVVIKAGLFDLLQIANTPLFLVSVFVVTFFVLMMSLYFSEAGGFSNSESLIVAVSLVIATLLISGVWAIGSRLVSHEFRFLQHLAVLSIIMLTAELIEMTIDYVYFIYSPDSTLKHVAMLLYSAIAVLWIFIHLCVVSRSVMMKKFIISFFIVGAFAGLIQLQIDMAEDGEIGVLEFSSQIKPHGQHAISFVTIEQLFEEAQALKSQLDANVGQ